MPAGPFTGLTGLCHFRIQLPGKGQLRLGSLRGGRAALWKRAGNPEASIPAARPRLLPFPGRPQRCRHVVPAADDVPRAASRSEERRVGKELVSASSYRWSPPHSKNKKKKQKTTL